jgi:hypothetical protein
MATRSLIGKLNSDNTVSYIYCHFDGYPEHNGVILQEHYDTPFKVDHLLALGDLSVLGEVIGEKQDFNNYSTRNNNWCLAYGRDRGESGVEMRTVSQDEFFNSRDYVDYLYLYNNDFEWECYNTWTLELQNIPAVAAA